MKNYLFILIVSSLLLVGCKSSKTIGSGKANYDLSAKQVIRENAKKAPEFNTLASRVKIDIVEGEKVKGYTVNMRLEKDKKILLMSTPISVVKALITPEKVSFYNKLDNTFFEGDYAYLSELLGTELDFKKVQNLLIGEALFNLKEEPYKVSIHEEAYALQPKNQLELFEIFYLLNPSHFKIKSQQISQPNEFRHLQIDYLAHQEIDKQVLPERIKVIAVEANDEMILDLEFKSVSLNEKLRFPFKIPSGYDEIKL
ncbi:DUF4292 domain-containing protein [uncultured Algibacter sp.]|uniref:DUF4292 domain-containing protein n=1 Tax=uncultured Algibacter sp. TaxID=298659 RepID=UPI0026333455|nr:DUF4292 domain-containing protein [uncultured Algibacter sp.]